MPRNTVNPPAPAIRTRDPRRKGLAALWLFMLWTAWGLQAPVAAIASSGNPHPIRSSAHSPAQTIIAQRPGSEPIDTRLRKAQRNGAPGADPDRRRGPEPERAHTPITPVPPTPVVIDDGLIGHAIATHLGSECARRGMRTAGRDPPDPTPARG